MSFRKKLQKTWTKATSRAGQTQVDGDVQPTPSRPAQSVPGVPPPSGTGSIVWDRQAHIFASEGSSLFQNSHDFVINNLNIVNQELHERPKVMKELKDYIIPGAEFNSAERDPPPRCHPGTRTSIREEVRAQIESAQTRIVWIHGPAGVGKSAIMQSLAEEVSPRHVCATLFLSRFSRDDPKRLFITLAYSLAVVNLEYRQYIGARMEDDPQCLTKSLDDQFKTLFITPFIENRVAASSPPWIMFLDGLDECENFRDTDNQSRILTLIGDSTFHHAKAMPFTWVVASRPEGNLKTVWSQIQRRYQGRLSELWELVIPANSDQATQDVELYLHKQFEMIRDNYSDLMPGPRWPSDSDFLRIARKSSGLFVFASTVIRYVSVEDPVYRLRHIITLIVKMEREPKTTDGNPFHAVDVLYSSVMSDIPETQLHVAKSLLGFYHLLSTVMVRRSTWEDRVRMKLVEACNILGLRQNEAYAALRKLTSVLIYPSPEMAQEKGIELFHASFSDFLLDRSRSQMHYLDLDEALTGIWRCFTRIIKQSRTPQGSAGVNLSWLPSNNAFPPEAIRRDLLQKACRGWVHILINHSFSESATRQIQADPSELIEAFQTVGVAFIAGHRFPVEDFLVWLNDRAPQEIQERLISQRFPLRQLDIERLFKALCVTPRYQYGMSSDVWEFNLATKLGDLDASKWAEVKAKLWTPSGDFHELVKVFDNEKVGVVVVGTEPSQSCAIIGPCTENVFGRNFYVLPYSVT